MNIINILFEKNTNHLCFLVTSLGDSLQIISIVNDWIFNTNYNNQAIKFNNIWISAVKITPLKQNL